MLLMRLLTLVGGGSVLLLSMLVVISQGFVVGGILSFLTFIGSSLPFLEPLLIVLFGTPLGKPPRTMNRDHEGICITRNNKN